MAVVKEFTILLLLALVNTLPAAQVTVFAAASLTESLTQIGAAYERGTGDRIVFNFAGSSTLARQIEAGAPADIFFSADEAKMNALQKQNLIVTDTRRSCLGNTLTVVVPTVDSVTIRTVKDLATPQVERIALGNPKVVPAGIYAKEYLESRKLWDQVAPKIVPTENVRAALAAVESGNVDAAIVYGTDAAISKKVKVAVDVPRDEGPAIRYPVALLKDARQPEAARRFLDFLASDTASAVFARYGFIVLGADERGQLPTPGKTRKQVR